MTTYVRYSPDGRVLDLTKLSRADYELISGLHGLVKRGDRTLLCLQAAGDDKEEMFIRRTGGKYWAVHFAGGAHGSHEISIESDEHRRQKDYWFRAAQDAGYPTAKEYRTGNGTILDVAIAGPRKSGIEVQRSQITLRQSQARTTKSHRAGWLSVWFSDSDRTPKWFHQIPSVGCNRISWDSLPPRRAATATGLRVMKALKCTVGAFSRCPDGKRRPCNKHHPAPEPWRGLTVDDVAMMVPAEQAVPLRMHNNHVYIVPPASSDLYFELTGLTGIYSPGSVDPARRTTRQTAEICHNPIHAEQLLLPAVGDLQEQPFRCAECGQKLLLNRPGRIYCQRCRPVPMTSECPW